MGDTAQTLPAEDVIYAPQPAVPEYAGFWIRVAARLIDLVVIYILAFATTFVFTIVVAVAAAVRQVPVQPLLLALRGMSAVSFLASLIAALAYGTLAAGLHGSSPGKMLLGLTVLAEDGSFAGMRAALVRELAYFVDGLFFALPAYLTMSRSPRLQRLGDQWAHTVVVRRRSLAPSQQRSVGRFIGVTLLSFAAYGAVIAASLAIKLAAA